MTVKSKTKSQLPTGLSPAEEAEWWDKNPDYWDATDTKDEPVAPSVVGRTRPVNLRLPVDMIEALKEEAAQQALPYQTLIRMWLKERLNARAGSR